MWLRGPIKSLKLLFYGFISSLIGFLLVWLGFSNFFHMTMLNEFAWSLFIVGVVAGLIGYMNFWAWRIQQIKIAMQKNKRSLTKIKALMKNSP